MGPVERVKRKLWTFAFSVKDVSGSALAFDLIVEGKYQVKVVEGNADIDSIPRSITVARVNGDEITYHRCSRGKCWEETSPLKAFPKVDTKD